MKLNFFILLLSFPLLLNGQGGLIIANGAKVVINNSPQIVIKDGKFKNDGDFAAGSGTVHLKGNTATKFSTISGMSITAFNNLTIDKTFNDVRLDFDIRVDRNLIMNSGLLILNYSDIVLGGKIIGETETTRITGTNGGAIIKTTPLDIPSNENPGNIGIEISSPFNLGSTTIRRSHIQMENQGNNSIHRRFDIDPENNVNLDASVRFHYFDAELAELNENDLEAWHYDDNDWESIGADTRNTIDNWVETSGISFFHTLTLAKDMLAPLPVELLRFDAVVNEKKQVDLSWATATEINNNYFTIERSKDGRRFEPIEDIPGAGNTVEARTYTAVDQRPYAGKSYYRLMQTDYDGTSSYSEIRAVNIELNQQFSVFPNPMKDILYVVGDGSHQGKAIVEIFDVLGNLKYYNRLVMDDNVSSITINEVAKFIAGDYFLVVRVGDETFNFNLVKVRK